MKRGVQPSRQVYRSSIVPLTSHSIDHAPYPPHICLTTSITNRCSDAKHFERKHEGSSGSQRAHGHHPGWPSTTARALSSGHEGDVLGHKSQRLVGAL